MTLGTCIQHTTIMHVPFTGRHLQAVSSRPAFGTGPQGHHSPRICGSQLPHSSHRRQINLWMNNHGSPRHLTCHAQPPTPTPETCSSVNLVDDYMEQNYLFWDYCQGNHSCQFSMGAVSTASYQTQWSAFGILDIMIQKLLDTSAFPNLEKIVLVGHGGGADLILRHALYSEYAQSVSDKLRYVAGNPILFVYFDKLRPTDVNCGYDMINENKATCDFGPVSQSSMDSALAKTKQLVLETSGYNSSIELTTCPEYRWSPQGDGWMNAGWMDEYSSYPYQLHFDSQVASSWSGNYLKKTNTTEQIDAFAQMDVYMVQGLNDTAPWESYEDKEACSAMLQGPNHLAKGAAYHQYLYRWYTSRTVSYTHLRAHETPEHLVCRLLLEKKKKQRINKYRIYKQYKYR
eukprot:TRINITY_DN13914_c0_g2_i4.p1 TRINITY_DN13914_c0_g2~~TRINITY_DN13914_c0_g2_i4.p1  ORF type:complete len:402 (+),score=54.14 TRINITY_DN13914_c0_g2_i4:793-1998(+)